MELCYLSVGDLGDGTVGGWARWVGDRCLRSPCRREKPWAGASRRAAGKRRMKIHESSRALKNLAQGGTHFF